VSQVSAWHVHRSWRWTAALESTEDRSCRVLDSRERILEGVGRPVVEANLVARRNARDDADAGAHDERHGFCLGLTHRLQHGTLAPERGR
jgi:hypothetical protein